jgi:hypothetical protein
LLIPLARGLVRTWRVRPKQAFLLGAALTVLSVAYGTYLMTASRTPL